MSSEADTDVPDTNLSSKPKTKVIKRDPNEPIPENWQRRLHLADHMLQPNPKEPWELVDDQLTLKSENLSFVVGEHIFVSNPLSPLSLNTSPIHYWDVNLPSFRIARITDFQSTDLVNVQWLVRPVEIQFRTSDSREVYLSSRNETIELGQIRGKATVNHRQEVRNLSKYREKPACFWFDKWVCLETVKLWDVLLVSSLKSLGPAKVLELGYSANYAVVGPGIAAKLNESFRKRKLSDTEEVDNTELDEKAIAKLSEERLRQPFKYFDTTSKQWSSWPKHSPRVGKEYQIEIPDWQGKPLIYYTWSAPTPKSRSKTLKLVEPAFDHTNGDTNQSIDQSKPWVQEMPSGYIPRGNSGTSTAISLPNNDISRFVSKCQESYAASLEIEPYNLQFLDECCSAFISTDDENKALIAVSLLSRKQLKPELSAAEQRSFWLELNPFMQKNWHSIYRAIGSKPMPELSQYYWVSLPLQPQVPPERLYLHDNVRSQDLCCVICHTESAPEWQPLPGIVHVPLKPIFEDKNIAMCSRCARLWYRYNVCWLPHTQVFEGSTDDKVCEPELVDDANCQVSEQDRRAKRRQAAQEKREATVQKKSEAKEAKKQAKAAKKELKSAKTSNNSGSELVTDKVSTGDEATTPGTVDQASKVSKQESNTTKKPEKKPKVKKEAESVQKKKNKEASGHKKPIENSDTDDGSTTEESDSNGRARASRKSLETQLSLDVVDDILTSIDEDVEPDAAEVPNYCCVCGQLDPSMAQLTCCSCHLNVHAACYGQSDLKDDSAWLCDCCLNIRGRLEIKCDQSYQCVLCSPRSPSYASWLAGSKTIGAPDVLKATMEKSWCHLRCAVWTPNVTFTDPANLSGIDISKVRDLINCQRHECSVCASKGGPVIPALLLGESSAESHKTANQLSTLHSKYMGTKLKCDLCDLEFHVSCAVDHGCQIGFGQSGPVVVCAKHPAPAQITPMSKLDLNLLMTEMQMFVGTHKVSKQKLGAKDRVRLFEWTELSMHRLETVSHIPLVISKDGIEDVCYSAPQCSECRTTKANYWHKVGKNLRCSQCFRGISLYAKIDGEALISKFRTT